MSNTHSTAGMTLIETIIVVALYVLLMGAVMTGVVHLYQTNSYTINQSYEIDLGRRGLQNWLRDTREMAYGDDGTFPLAVVEPFRIGFFSDVDNDPSVEYVEYFLATTTLYRHIYKATGSPPTYVTDVPDRIEIISEFIQNLEQTKPVFFYYDTNGDLLAHPELALTDIRYLEAEIIVNIDPQRSPGEFLLRSGVSPRNLKDNL